MIPIEKATREQLQEKLKIMNHRIEVLIEGAERHIEDEDTSDYKRACYSELIQILNFIRS